MYLNRITFLGRLTKDPLFSKGSSEDGSNDRCWGCVASNRPKPSEDVDYVPFVCWGATARAVAQYAKKGEVLILDGALRTRSTKREEDDSYDNYFKINCYSVSFGPDVKNQPTAAAKAADAPAKAAAAPTASAPALDLATLQAVLAQMMAGQQKSAPAQVEADNPFDIPL